MPPVNYDQVDGVDTASAFEAACRNIKGYEWNEEDLEFYFNQIEIKMQAVGVKKQFTKLQVLSTILPQKVTNQVKPLLRKKETDFPDKDSYLQIKTKILQIFGPAPNLGFERAMSRTLTVNPSTLGREIIDDMCPHELDGCCCHKWVYGLWLRSLPGGVRQGIAGQEFTSETYQDIFQLADDIYGSTKPVLNQSVAAVSAPVASHADGNPMEDAFSAQLPAGTNAEALLAAVAALGVGRGRGRGRSGRGRGRGAGRGNRNQNNTSQTQGQAQSQGNKHPKHGTPRHADLPPFQTCWRHWTFGRSAHFCQEPSTCPWKDIWIPKANTQ